jgi:divalent metal cation (Fe/Co/Zn/Cd) transporter
MLCGRAGLLLLLLLLLLLQDHLNDIMSNTGAIITAVAAGHVPNGFWIDPAGAIAISLYIVARWLAIAKQQVESLHQQQHMSAAPAPARLAGCVLIRLS